MDDFISFDIYSSCEPTFSITLNVCRWHRFVRQLKEIRTIRCPHLFRIRIRVCLYQQIYQANQRFNFFSADASLVVIITVFDNILTLPITFPILSAFFSVHH